MDSFDALSPSRCRERRLNNMKLFHWPLMGGELGGAAARPGPSWLLAVPNVTARPSAASVPITVLL